MNTITKNSKITDSKTERGVLDNFQLFYEELPVNHFKSGAPKTTKAPTRLSRRSKR